MFMPNLIPRDVHHLWLKTESNKSQGPSTSQSRPSSNSHNDSSLQQQQRIERDSSLSNYAPPLSSYSSERPGAILPSFLRSINDFNSNYTPELISTDVELRLRQLRSIRTLGFSYLAPLGIGKTMETIEEEVQIKMQMNEQYHNDIPTAENLLGEAEQDQNRNQNMSNTENGSTQRFTNETANIPSSAEQEEQQQPVQNQQQLPPQSQETREIEVDLDGLISDAESYSNNYDIDEENDLMVNDGDTFESQYDRGFMVREQYDQYDEGTPSSNAEIQLSNTVHSIHTPQGQHSYNSGHHIGFVTPSRSNDISFANSAQTNLHSSFSYSANRFHQPIEEEQEEFDEEEGDQDMTFDD